ncbi:MAG: hypothetical protein OJF59_000735 [Cytophagales bacterium]|jgi:DNA-directed RNA polymerase subunit L|nr:hypothetical protein [Bacteroidota bacterium]MBS1979727.1 hypothetical protein [Bacteroidota bacterium]WHZ06982.1 MAG: hypothetical protein OJF59_000735 [Cytophagales bacterium]
MSNKFTALLILVLASGYTLAQPVTIKKQNEKVKGESTEGFAVALDGKRDDVNAQWSKFLKEIGRVKLFSSEPVVITEPNFNGTVYPKGIIYAHIFEEGKQTRVWLGILKKDWEEKEIEFANKQLEKLVYRFGVQYNRSLVQIQIDESIQASQAVEKQQQRLINQSKELAIQLSNNEQEKAQLQKSMDANKLENEALKIKIEKNKKAQDSLVRTATQIKKVTEGHKERLRKVN